MIKNKQYISLLELQERIKEKIEDSFLDMLWVSGTIAQINENPSGHCYITLVEHEENEIVSKVNAIIWASSYRLIKPYFESMAGEPLSEGMKILVKARVQYSQIYGLSVIITDIDPVFTVGESFLEKQRIIEKLKHEGMMDLNSSLEMSIYPKRIAVVSAETAAGYGDFMNHIQNNEFGFRFSITLFSSPMQGKDAPSGIIAALERIAERESEYDAVVLMRGGGSSTDLACFDDYDLAVNIAQFPLPVITAIGHERDYHIVDMVAYRSLKTPTASADFFIDIFVSHLAQINSLATRLLIAIKNKKIEENNRLELVKMRLMNNVSTRISDQSRLLDLLELKVNTLNPKAVLDRGFAALLKNGRRIVSIDEVDIDDEIVMLLKDGTAEIKILKKIKNNNE